MPNVKQIEVDYDESLNDEISSVGYEHYKSKTDKLTSAINDTRNLINSLIGGLFLFTGVLANPIQVNHISQKLILFFNITVIFLFWIYFHKSISITSGIDYDEVVKAYKLKQLDEGLKNTKIRIDKESFREFLYKKMKIAYDSAFCSKSILMNKRDVFIVLVLIQFLTVILIAVFPGLYFLNLIQK